MPQYAEIRFCPQSDEHHEEPTNESIPLETIAKDLAVGDENVNNESNTQSDEHHEQHTTESIPLQTIAKDLTTNENSHEL